MGGIVAIAAPRVRPTVAPGRVLGKYPRSLQVSTAGPEILAIFSSERVDSIVRKKRAANELETKGR